jgi:hypothetical protein
MERAVIKLQVRGTWENQRDREDLKDLRVTGNIILKWIFYVERERRNDTDYSGSGSRQMAGLCYYSNKHSGYRKRGRFLEELRKDQLLSNSAPGSYLSGYYFPCCYFYFQSPDNVISWHVAGEAVAFYLHCKCN